MSAGTPDRDPHGSVGTENVVPLRTTFVPAKYVVTFKPGKEMEERVRLLEEREAAAQKAAETVVPEPQPPLGGYPRPEQPAPPASPIETPTTLGDSHGGPGM